MAKNFVEEGKTVAIVASAAISSGDLVQVGDVFAVALTDIPQGETGDGLTEGVFMLPKLKTDDMKTGKKVYLKSGKVQLLGFDLSSLSLNANGGIYQSADLSRYSGTVVNRPTFFAFAKGAGVMGEAGPEAILPLRRGADGKLGVVADIGGSGMAMFAPQYNIEINNDGTNGQIGPAALKVVYDLGKKAAADFMQHQARDGGRLSGAYR